MKIINRQTFISSLFPVFDCRIGDICIDTDINLTEQSHYKVDVY